MINEIVSQFQDVDILFAAPEAYISKNMEITMHYQALLNTVFDQRKYLMVSKLEEALVTHCLKEPHTLQEDLLIRFCIGGASHIITDQLTPEETERSRQFLVQIIQKLSK